MTSSPVNSGDKSSKVLALEPWAMFSFPERERLRVLACCIAWKLQEEWKQLLAGPELGMGGPQRCWRKKGSPGSVS